MALIDLFSETYLLDEKGNGSQRLINMYYEAYKESATKTGKAIVPRPGFHRLLSTGSLPSEICRGLYFSTSGTAPDFVGRLYGVWGDKVYRFTKEVDGFEVIGNVVDDTKPVSMTDNGFKFVVVDGATMFSAPLNDADGIPNYVQVSLPVVPKTGQPIEPTHVEFLGERLVCNSRNANFFFYSNITSPTTLTGGEVFQAENFYSAKQHSGATLALKVVNGRLGVFGRRSYEFWDVTPNQDSPFSFVSGSSNAIGCEAPYSVAAVGDTCFWLASSDVGTSSVYMSNGSTITDITGGIYDAIRPLVNRDSAIGYAYSVKGTIFYVLTFKASERTFCFDTSTEKWHELLLRDLLTGGWLAYPYQFATVVNGEIYVGLIDHDSCLCRMEFDKYLEWDDRIIVREGISIPYFDNLDEINVTEIMLDMEVGETDVLSGYGKEPTIGFQLSRDGGRTFGNVVYKNIGRQGQYRNLVRVKDCGVFRNIAVKILFSAPAPCAIFQARMSVKKWGES